ncbi:metal ABC transporter permease [Candidatus Chloroploca sp. Khr17]|uniref:metal ABC transporter permease n=1 Tax=Candidatus Chloroploca sp. Khr17 TaxID=2496869 RepID=UPI00101DB48E|nr:metal ABC transporter permease [Candidatus Chloroploca sp. Khr17]
MSSTMEVQLIAIVVAAACALPGVFLVLRRMAMMSDAISHTVLLGIVLGYFVTRDLASPLLFAGAVATGVLTVSLVEMLTRTNLIKEDAAIGLVFPVLFSIAVILISRYAGNVHLDTDAVLLGELAFAPFDRITWGWLDLPRALLIGSITLVLNLGLIVLLYKELKLATFDVGLAATLGFSPVLVHYGLMTVVSITAVGAFDAVGSILVVALMVAPPAAAYLLTDRLSRMLGLSVAIAVLSAVLGYWFARWFNVSIAGSMAMMTGVAFLVAFLFAPARGLVALGVRRSRQRWEFAQQMLTLHLLNHEGTAEADDECSRNHLSHHLRWQPRFAATVIRLAEQGGLIQCDGMRLMLTEQGRRLAQEASLR